MMAAGLAALQSLRPAFDAFYGTLTPVQRIALDAFAVVAREEALLAANT